MLCAIIVELAVCKVAGASRGSTLPTRLWTLEVRGPIKLKQESSRAWMACGTLEAADTVHCLAHLDSWAKVCVWEELGKGHVAGFQSTQKKFWQTIQWLRRGERHLVHTVYSEIRNC